MMRATKHGGKRRRPAATHTGQAWSTRKSDWPVSPDITTKDNIKKTFDLCMKSSFEMVLFKKRIGRGVNEKLQQIGCLRARHGFFALNLCSGPGWCKGHTKKGPTSWSKGLPLLLRGGSRHGKKVSLTKVSSLHSYLQCPWNLEERERKIMTGPQSPNPQSPTMC